MFPFWWEFRWNLSSGVKLAVLLQKISQCQIIPEATLRTSDEKINWRVYSSPWLFGLIWICLKKFLLNNSSHFDYMLIFFNIFVIWVCLSFIYIYTYIYMYIYIYIYIYSAYHILGEIWQCSQLATKYVSQQLQRTILCSEQEKGTLLHHYQRLCRTILSNLLFCLVGCLFQSYSRSPH